MFIRSKNNPILKSNKNNDWESRKVYNCGAGDSVIRTATAKIEDVLDIYKKGHKRNL